MRNRLLRRAALSLTATFLAVGTVGTVGAGVASASPVPLAAKSTIEATNKLKVDVDVDVEKKSWETNAPYHQVNHCKKACYYYQPYNFGGLQTNPFSEGVLVER